MANPETSTAAISTLQPEERVEVQTTLERLIKLNFDGIGAYAMATELLESDHYIQICQEFIEQRKHFIDELSQMIVRYGAPPPDSQSFAGLMNDVWMNIQSMVSGNDTALITECDRGNELAVDFYYNAINESLPKDVDTLIRNQFSMLKGEHERIHRLAAALHQ